MDRAIRIAWLDCPAGIAGDMTLAALVHAGASLADVRDAIRRVVGDEVAVDVEGAESSAIHGLRLRVVERPPAGRPSTVDCQRSTVDPDHGHHHHDHDHDHDHPHEHDHDRSARDILDAIAGAGLPARVADRATAVFRALAAAEAEVHGTTPDAVHFHEVGALDSIADIVGVAAALESLDIDEVAASPLPMTWGHVRTRHGLMPVPAPATLAVLKGWPVRGEAVEGEFVTPTGAAICAALATPGTMPPMRVRGTGWGFGRKAWPDGRPNAVRVVIGDRDPVPAGAVEWQVEANLDDATPEQVSRLAESLLEAGAVDAWTTAITMKKGRPAWTVAAIVGTAERDRVVAAFFAESPTLGLRLTPLERVKLPFEVRTVPTSVGDVRVKVARHEGRVCTVAPEPDDLRRIARERGLSLRRVREIVAREIPAE